MKTTIAQALALKAMFKYWNSLSSMGSSRKVGFYVDGDGNFHPECIVTTDVELPELTDDMAKAAIVEDRGGNRIYDFDSIAWMLHKNHDKLNLTNTYLKDKDFGIEKCVGSEEFCHTHNCGCYDDEQCGKLECPHCLYKEHK
jgi:hypothetical protein